MSIATTLTQHRTETVTDENILEAIAQFDEEIQVDGLPCNVDALWKALLHPAHADIRGDELIVRAAIASLSKNTLHGCRTSHAKIARRATSIKKMLALARQVEWKRIIEVIAQSENA